MTNQILWVEHYRPRKISECILPQALKKTFLAFVKKNELPNLLLSGGSGVGKTTVARALCEELHRDYMIINGQRNLVLIFYGRKLNRLLQLYHFKVVRK